MTALIPGWGAFVPEREAATDDGIEEALRLAGTGAGRDEGRPALRDCADGVLLVAVKMGDLGRDSICEVRVEQTFTDQIGDGRALPERAREAHVGSLEKRGAAGLVEGEKRPHLRVQARVREGIRGELVAEEAPNDVLGVRDGVQRHRAFLRHGPGPRTLFEKWFIPPTSSHLQPGHSTEFAFVPGYHRQAHGARMRRDQKVVWPNRLPADSSSVRIRP